jgi:DNA-binding GntR family transcriptional regulator
MSAHEAIAFLKSRSLGVLIEPEIERMIMSGEIKPGDRINENALALRFGTSRGPIREALRSMEAGGLVELVPNRGVYVRSLDLASACAIYEVRAALFGMAGRCAAERAGDEQVSELRALVAEMDRAVEAEDFETYYPLNLAFHRAILAASGNRLLAAQYASLIKQLHLYRARSLVQGGGMHVSNQEHRAMVDAIAARDPDAAHRTHFDHVMRSLDRLRAAPAASPST